MCQESVYYSWIAGFLTAAFAPFIAELLKRKMSKSKLSVAILGARRVENRYWEVRVAFRNTGTKESTFTTSHLLLDRDKESDIYSFSKFREFKDSEIDRWAFNSPVLIRPDSVVVETLYFLEGLSNLPEMIRFYFDSGDAIAIDFTVATQEYAMFFKDSVEKWIHQIHASTLNGSLPMRPIWRSSNSKLLR